MSNAYTVQSGAAFKKKKRGPKALPFVDISKWDIVPAEPRHWLVYDRIPRRQPTSGANRNPARSCSTPPTTSSSWRGH